AGGVGDVPVGAVEHFDDDLAFGGGAAGMERGAAGVGVFGDLGRDVLGVDVAVAGGDDDAFDDVAQFADVVAAPVVGGEDVQCVVGDRFPAHPEPVADRGQEVVHEE